MIDGEIKWFGFFALVFYEWNWLIPSEVASDFTSGFYRVMSKSSESAKRI